MDCDADLTIAFSLIWASISLAIALTMRQYKLRR